MLKSGIAMSPHFYVSRLLFTTRGHSIPGVPPVLKYHLIHFSGALLQARLRVSTRTDIN
ncbi:hypothetical protein STEG23_021913, partial [Scotinomys teguina]